MIKEMKEEREILHKQLLKLAEDQSITHLPDEDKYISSSMADIYNSLHLRQFSLALLLFLVAHLIVCSAIKIVNISRRFSC